MTAYDYLKKMGNAHTAKAMVDVLKEAAGSDISNADYKELYDIAETRILNGWGRAK